MKLLIFCILLTSCSSPSYWGDSPLTHEETKIACRIDTRVHKLCDELNQLK